MPCRAGRGVFGRMVSYVCSIVIVIVIGGLKSDGLTAPCVGTERSYPA